MVGYYVSNFPKLSETFISREVILLKKKGFNLKLFASKQPDEEEKKLFSEETNILNEETSYFTKNRVLVELLKSPFKIIKFLKISVKLSKEATKKPNPFILLGRAILLCKHAKSNNITQFHAHWPYATMVVFLASKISKIPFSISIHAHEMFHENGHFKRTLQDMSFASFCNKAAMDVVIKKYPHLKEKCHLVYHGVNLENFPLLKTPEIEKEIKIITAGRLTKTKGFDRLIKFCALARKKNINVSLTILGMGDMRDSLLNLASKLNFKDFLEMPGWVDREQVRDYMANAHVFVLVADVNYHDGLPNVALEAMAVGRPAILSPLPAAKEAIKDKLNGFILQNLEDKEAFIEILNNIITKKINLNELSLNARQTAEDYFSDDFHINQLIALHNNVK